jgi:hypothetical protein
MNSEIQVRLLDAVGRCLRPLVRMLLRSGISYRQFDEIVKQAFVHESFVDSGLSRKRTNVSRVAVRTGLSRKEVARIRDLMESEHVGEQSKRDAAYRSGQAARLLQVWHTDPRFIDVSGRPIDLPFDDAGEGSFSAIVRSVGGDVPAGAVRAELLSAGAIEELEGGRLRAVKRYFIPGDLGEDMVVGFEHFVSPLLSGLAHNSSVPKSEAFIQRVSYSENLSASTIPRFKRIAHERAADFVQSVDEWIAANEEPASELGKSDTRVGVGVFYFERKDSDEPKK